MNSFTTTIPSVRLYGHGFELLTVACNHAYTIIASACKATQPEHAVIRLWNLQTGSEVGDWGFLRPPPSLSTSKFSQICTLPGHKLSVVQLAFSPSDTWLVSASRDRSWSLYKKTSDPKKPYSHVVTKVDAHERIIW